MASKRELMEKFGQDRDGKTVVVCPTCGEDTAFESLEEWKAHMQKEHGGYTSSEVAEGLSAELPSGKEAVSSSPQPPPKPKRMSQRARELNDAVNRCVSLVIKHIISGITQDEQAEMEQLRTKVTEAFVGIEFDFEERLFSLTGKWAVLTVLVLLYTLPSIPSMKEVIAKAREKAAQKRDE
jgi:uncharacterized C2H2 Zn-finger protein